MASKSIFLVFPNQLFDQSREFWSNFQEVHLVEHDIGFGGPRSPVPRFHIKRLMYLRASMQNYQTELEKIKITTKYVHHKDWKSHFSLLQKSKSKIATYRPSDYKLEEDITHLAKKGKIELEWHPNPNWILTEEECVDMLGKPPFKNYTFYAEMRKKYNILLTKSGEPVGGVVRFDVENREKIPTSELDDIPSSPSYPVPVDVAHSILKDFPDALAVANLDDSKNPTILFPMSRVESKKALVAFIKKKLAKKSKATGLKALLADIAKKLLAVNPSGSQSVVNDDKLLLSMLDSLPTYSDAELVNHTADIKVFLRIVNGVHEKMIGFLDQIQIDDDHKKPLIEAYPDIENWGMARELDDGMMGSAVMDEIINQYDINSLDKMQLVETAYNNIMSSYSSHLLWNWISLKRMNAGMNPIYDLDATKIDPANIKGYQLQYTNSVPLGFAVVS